MTTITEILELYRKECFSCGTHRRDGDITAFAEALSNFGSSSYSEGYSFAKRENGLVEEASKALHYNED
jgi:hypothetical protein